MTFNRWLIDIDLETGEATYEHTDDCTARHCQGACNESMVDA